MARKYDLISELYNRTCKTVVSNPQSWQAFLQSACRNYKLRYDEQLLVFAQRPDATAVLEIERWNRSFGRWVNRGARGIAVFADENRERQRLTHYFDISDTHESRYSRPVPLWNMRQEYEADVIETLESTFGEIDNKSNLAEAVICAARNAAEDNLPDYIRDLLYSINDSFLEGLDEDSITYLYREVVTNSVAYMMMSRLGIDTESYFEDDDFRDVTNFNTQETLNALGFATSDIAEMGLSEIAKTVMALDRQNRIIAGQNRNEYNGVENKTERSFSDERTDIHDGGRLQPAESEIAEAAGSESWQVRTDEEKVPEGTAPGSVLQLSDGGQADGTLGRGGTESNRDGGTPDEADGGEGRTDRADEGGGYDEVGSLDEQSEEPGSGNGTEGSNLRLEYYDRSHEDKSLPFFGGDDTIREIIATTPHLKASKDEIRAFYENVADEDRRTEYIKSIFNNDYTELILSDDRRIGYKTYQNVLQLWEGSFTSRTKQSFYDWGVIAKHFEAMRLLGELQDTMKPLPSMDGQMSFIFDYEAEVTKPSAFTFSQEIIDAVLTRGSGVSEGKLRIYEQFQKSFSHKENADFLKNEYGWGGSYPVIVGAGIDEQHDGKGIRISKGIGNDKPHILLSWKQVEKRIGELIRLDRYLNPREKAHYPEWLEKQETRRAELKEQQKNREILSAAPTERAETADEDTVGKEVTIDNHRYMEETELSPEQRYEYHLGDKVYIGAAEYEILSFDDNRVMLYDFDMPLFNKEFTRTDFDQKVRENPMNDHLKVKELPPEKEIFIDPNTTPIGDEDYYFHRPGMEEFEAIHYNPDSNAGGQFVVLHISYELIAEAKANSSTVSKFYEYLDSKAYTELIDVGTQEFSDYLEAYAEPEPDYIGRTEETMQALISQAERAYYDIGMGYLGNGLTVWNRAVEEHDDYHTIAHISNEGEIKYYVDGLPDDVVSRIEQAAEQEKQKALFAATYKLGDKVYLEGKPFEITRTDDWNVELMDRSLQNPTPRLESKDSFMQLVQQNEYSRIKHDNPNAIVLYEAGDFFEAYGNDASYLSDIFALNLTNKTVGGELVSMCGIPSGQLETYLNMLTDRGNDVAIASLENGERITRTVVSTNKEDPVQSQPIGRIEYLNDGGDVIHTDEYTSEYQFKKDIAEESSYGTRLRFYVYRNADGETIDQTFIAKLDTPLNVYEIIDSPYLQITEPETPLDKAKALIDEYCREEFEREEGADYSDLSAVEVAYTTTEDEKHEIQARVNLVDFQIETLVDGKVFRGEQFSTLEDMIERGLESLSFDDLVYLSDEELARADKASEAVVPAWEQKKKERVRSYDLHPEIPMAERNNFNLKENEVETVGKKERFRRNMEAIRVLKECEFDNRFATPEEQIILSKYVGWGGLSEAFDENNSAWADEFVELYTTLSPDEYASARESTLTAFYTPPEVVAAIYRAMEQMGFQEGNLLEPSCGIGNFIGMLPDSMKDSKIYGVEIDKISAGIAQQLYQKSSIAAQGFEEVNLPDSFFDGVIGNVPFGDFKVPDKRYDKHKFLIHDYFFAKSLDKLRPGGVMALVTSKGTMDKENSSVRKYIAQRAELLGAIRLPNDTFKGNAGTEVVSDILILQKRDRLIDIEPDWVHLDTDENGIKMNSYFVQHPEMILGEMKLVSGRFGMEATCEPYENADLKALLDEAVSNIHGELSVYEVEEELEEEDNSIPADPNVRNFSYTVVDDKIYYRENSRMTPVEVSATAENRIKGMLAIRDSVRNLIELQTEDYPDSEIKVEQEKLNRLYDTFSGKYGLINNRANSSAFSQDSSFSLLSALEVLDEDGNLERKADMFFKRTIKPHTPVTSVDTASEALAVSLGEKAAIDMEYMMELSGKSEKEIFEELKGVIFLNPLYEYGNHPGGKYLMADEYLSGNVREKLRIARNSAQLYPEDYQVNVEALEKVQPKDLTASEISVRLGATWLPPDDVQDFMFYLLETPRYAQWNIKVHFSPYTSEWNIEGKSYDRGNVKAYNTYGTSRINAYKIIEETLNLKDVRIFDYAEDDEGKKKAILNKKETAIAQSKQELIKGAFQDWIWSDPSRRERLCRIYNEKFNSIRPREYDGSHITFNGMNPEIELREHQKNAVAHILYGGNTLLAHAVGAGKTFEMVAAAQESKRLGLCNKSLFVVPNHLTEQWAAEYLQLYPAANILVATKKDFETKNRKKFCGRIATGDYDAVIIGHSQFEKIPMSIERQRAILEQQLDEITVGIAELKRNRGENFSVKQLEKSKKSIKQKLDKLNDQSRKDDVVTFEELGVDRLFIDESHYYKNLYLYTKMRNVGGIAQTEAQKSSDLFMKCRYLDEITGGRGTVFATGTPISNSMVELYTIQRYLQYNTLVQNGLQHFDAWASTFGETITAVELTPEGYNLVGR